MIVTPEYLREIFNYDPETGIIRWRKKINRRVVVGKIAGSISQGRINIMIDYVNYKGHIVAWAIYYGVWPDFEIDHEDTNASNNRIKNLRKSTRSQNMANTNPRTNTQSGFKGVVADKNRWLARITVNYKRIRIGLFSTKKEAAAAYAKAAQHYFGEFSRTDNAANGTQTEQLDKLISGIQ